jgi:hypothetical protein
MGAKYYMGKITKHIRHFRSTHPTRILPFEVMALYDFSKDNSQYSIVNSQFLDFSLNGVDGLCDGDLFWADAGTFEMVHAAPNALGIIHLLQSLRVLFIPGIKDVAECPYKGGRAEKPCMFIDHRASPHTAGT